jgi:hypothetical protein
MAILSRVGFIGMGWSRCGISDEIYFKEQGALKLVLGSKNIDTVLFCARKKSGR